MFFEGLLLLVWSQNTVNVFCPHWVSSVAMAIYVEQFLSPCLQAELTKYICDHQDKISGQLKECCDKPLLQKSHCIANVHHDDAPADLPTLASVFVEDKDVCKNFQETKDVFLGS